MTTTETRLEVLERIYDEVEGIVGGLEEGGECQTALMRVLGFLGTAIDREPDEEAL